MPGYRSTTTISLPFYFYFATLLIAKRNQKVFIFYVFIVNLLPLNTKPFDNAKIWMNNYWNSDKELRFYCFIYRGTFNEGFRPTATPVATHGFYETLEAENPCRNDRLTSSYERTNKQIAASKIPTWAWKILVKLLGIRQSSDSHPYLSLILHAITVLLACTFTVTGVIHTVLIFGVNFLTQLSLQDVLIFSLDFVGFVSGFIPDNLPPDFFLIEIFQRVLEFILGHF